MIEKITKIAENVAKKESNKNCLFDVFFHQPKMPKSLVKKD